MKQLYIILFLISSLGFAQTSLNAGDISIFWNQTDIPDDFAFVTYVDLESGTVIYFTDCGTSASASAPFNNPCTEGAYAYTVPVGGHSAGDIIKFEGVPGEPVTNPTNLNFSTYNDTIITGNLGTSTGGDQIIVFQDASNPGGSAMAASNPKFLFVSNTASTLFTGTPTDSNETNLPPGLSDVGLPRTALGVGAGPAADEEVDNSVYNGTYTFDSFLDAKIALTNPANYYATNTNLPGDAVYNALVSAIPPALTITTLSVNPVGFDKSLRIFPNPSNGHITIKNSGVALNELLITDLNGRVIFNQNLNGNVTDQQLDLRSVLHSGLYFMTLTSGSEITVKKLFIK
ncbi:T9SS type A sorting domain-containing protein [Psychroserpens mesophilus]|uniref:T9SS type A sorting domain-containing protein n=1 Tax=Psychroserpens mesophilus TaxID=325473 RepID=UPI003F492A62